MVPYVATLKAIEERQLSVREQRAVIDQQPLAASQQMTTSWHLLNHHLTLCTRPTRHAGTSGGELSGKKVVVVGAGPAGICAAMALANLGATVSVCEQRREDTFAGTSKRSYVIILQDRGLNALQDAGFTGLNNKDSRCVHAVGAVLHVCAYRPLACSATKGRSALAGPIAGRATRTHELRAPDANDREHATHVARARRFLGSVNINAKGKKRASKSQQETAVGFERRQLAQLLRDQAAERHPDRIRFEFDRTCAGGNLEGGVVTFRRGEGERLVEERFDLLVGADGQNSRVRALLEDQARHSPPGGLFLTWAITRSICSLRAHVHCPSTSARCCRRAPRDC